MQKVLSDVLSLKEELTLAYGLDQHTPGKSNTQNIKTDLLYHYQKYRAFCQTKYCFN